MHTDGDLPVLDVTAVVPDPDAPDLRPGPPSGVPLQVWLPALINLIVVPLVTWSTLQRWSDPATDHVLAAATLVGSLIIAVMAFSMFARSGPARRVLLAVAAVVGLTHMGGLFYDSTDLQSGHTLGAMVAILVLMALSSPKVTEWTPPGGRDRPETARFRLVSGSPHWLLVDVSRHCTHRTLSLVVLHL